MSCAAEVERFRPGTSIRLPFLVVADDTIVDISDGVMSAKVAPIGGETITLGEGSGIEIVDPSPTPAPPGGEQSPHGFLTLTPPQTELLPLGQLTELTIYYLTPEGVLTYTAPVWLRGE